MWVVSLPEITKCPYCNVWFITDKGCPKCGYKPIKTTIDFIEFPSRIEFQWRKPYEEVVASVTPPQSYDVSGVEGSVSEAAGTVSCLSGAYYDAKFRLGFLRNIGINEKYLEPLENDVNRVYEDKIKAEEQLKELYSKPTTRDLEKFSEEWKQRLENHGKSVTRQFELLSLKVNGTNTLVRKLAENVATKEDIERTESVLVKNQEILQRMLKQNIGDIRQKLEGEIEEKIGKKKANRFWRILEKISTISDTIQFAQYVKEFLVFLCEQKIIQTVLPLILEMLTRLL